MSDPVGLARLPADVVDPVQACASALAEAVAHEGPAMVEVMTDPDLV